MSNSASPVDPPGTLNYRGRFAPSPTGPLHFGSLVAAVASYAQALAHGGEWLVRIEDIDPTREMQGAAASILASLEAHGFEFPPPVYQSARLDIYDDTIRRLMAANLAYPCSCNRQILAATAEPGRAGLIYPGTCRNGADTSQRPAIAVRLRTAALPTAFADGLQGRMSCVLSDEIGDFLLRRGDGLVAYQTAVAVDDAAQGITEVVRGTDLLDSTFMQIYLLEQLGLSAPQYAHFPVVTGPDGEKLSKHNRATEINNNQSKFNILRALSFLLQEPPQSLKTASIQGIWSWVAENWDVTRLAGLRSRPEKSIMTR